MKNDFPLFIYLYKRIKKEGLNKHDIKNLVKNQDLKFMEYRVNLYNDFIKGQQLQKQPLEQEIDRLKNKISRLNHLPFESEYKTTK
jgi:hypothetical protein